MSDFKLHILGCGSALPTVRHMPTSQALELRGKLMLIDCGEGTQRQIRKQGLSFEAIRVILITHLHGDHIFGLPGLISTMSMLGRGRGLTIIGPRGTKHTIGSMLNLLCDSIGFDISIHEYNDRQSQLVFEDRSVQVYSIPLEHRMPTQGYLFKEICTERHIDKASCEFYHVPRSAYPALLRGEDWQSEEGDIVSNTRLTKMGRKPRSYAVCTDTAYIPTLASAITGVDLLYHEATFMSSESLRAEETQHSTASQAATVAQMGQVGQLLIGHYSARYTDITPLLKEAQAIFPNTLASNEGMIVEIKGR